MCPFETSLISQTLPRATAWPLVLFAMYRYLTDAHYSAYVDYLLVDWYR